MFGLSIPELLIIALVIIFVVGPKRLPDVAKSIGKGYGEFKRTFAGLKENINLDNEKISTPSSNSNKPKDHIKHYAEEYRSQWENSPSASAENQTKPEKKDNSEQNS